MLPTLLHALTTGTSSPLDLTPPHRGRALYLVGTLDYSNVPKLDDLVEPSLHKRLKPIGLGFNTPLGIRNLLKSQLDNSEIDNWEEYYWRAMDTFCSNVGFSSDDHHRIVHQGRLTRAEAMRIKLCFEGVKVVKVCHANALLRVQRLCEVASLMIMCFEDNTFLQLKDVVDVDDCCRAPFVQALHWLRKTNPVVDETCEVLLPWLLDYANNQSKRTDFESFCFLLADLATYATNPGFINNKNLENLKSWGVIFDEHYDKRFKWVVEETDYSEGRVVFYR